MVAATGLVGNCSFNALITGGRVSWLCWPRPDSSFVFGELIGGEEAGVYAIEPAGPHTVHVEYVDNTNILRTVFRGVDGDNWAFELIDFAPRFLLFGRWFRPTMLMRILRRLEGEPRIRVRCEPVYDYGRARPQVWGASNHLQFGGLSAPLRLTTNAPLTYVRQGTPFLLTRDLHFVLTWGEPLEAPLEDTTESFYCQTRDAWRRWVKSGRIPREWQPEVIRSALTLKLHQFDDTGALLAATTTSLPESPGSGRTWDYRYCWLRDAYFTIDAFERLGYAEEMEKFLLYLRNLCGDGHSELQPVYGIDLAADLEEHILDHLKGFQGDGPVRIGNQAYAQVQHDVYGELILSMSRLLLDSRFRGDEGVDGAGHLVQGLVSQIEQKLEEPDAGLWELRGSRYLHTFTLLTHWAGARRAVDIAKALGIDGLRDKSKQVMARASQLLWERCWNEKIGSFTQAAGRDNLDASSLLALHFGFLRGDDPRARRMVDAIKKQLELPNGMLKRYDVEDDFGVPDAAFTVCTFWLVDALAMVGRADDARALFDSVLARHNGLGLFAEDLLTGGATQSGNFPQTYSHVGLINAAFRLSRAWD
ncbi:MAG: glycoside hydrolase family 15 protein [Planctomycetes bacterium]|nr:glycoside hydrolase family 15 protein [Planctomycetota bacterium]